MIRHFDVIEADFQREYRIDLGVDVWWMPWRRFVVLLRGLSPTSGWYSLGKVDKDKPKVISGAAVDRYFATIGQAG